MKRIILALLSIFSLCAHAQDVEQVLPFALNAPKHEVRGVWLTTLWGLDWPKTRGTGSAVAEKQKADLCSILDELSRDGINTVFLQTRVRGTVIYPSKIEPWDACFTGTEGKAPSYDPLAFAIEECHKRGMELHAWVVTLPMGKTQSAKTVRAMRLIRHEGAYYMDPTRPETAYYIANVCREIVTNYDVDGIHFDYIRYPEHFARKRQNPALITHIVEESNKAIKALKPWVRFSCSPIGKAGDLARQSAKGWSAEAVGQEAVKWLRTGLMDMLCPMMYFKGDIFFPFAADWQERSPERGIVAPGMGIYFLSPQEKNWPLEEVTRELSFLRHMGLGGAVYFRERFLADNVKGLRTWLRNQYYTAPALLPPMEAAGEAEKPHLIGTSWDGTQGIIRVTGGSRYVLYASESDTIDITDASNIVKIVYADSDKSHPTDIRYDMLSARAFSLRFAVTALDRYGHESELVMVEPQR
ncbi:MAG: family 10 glycosylhydrolase [Bacteroidaceae bacterium]|nr:family 10 glycosylhydrolase [Bacteroidaceae bacterium]